MLIIFRMFKDSAKDEPVKGVSIRQKKHREETANKERRRRKGKKHIQLLGNFTPAETHMRIIPAQYTQILIGQELPTVGLDKQLYQVSPNELMC